MEFDASNSKGKRKYEQALTAITGSAPRVVKTSLGWRIISSVSVDDRYKKYISEYLANDLNVPSDLTLQALENIYNERISKVQSTEVNDKDDAT